jgi:hypothetical protein
VTGAGRRARTTRRHLLAAGLAGVAGFVSTACGYSLAGRGNFLPSYIRIIGIPQFTNNTTVFDLERTITERVRTEFIGRGRYQVVPDTEGVDAVLNGTIVGVALEPTGFDQNNQATRYLFRMTLSLEFKDVRADKVIWANAAQQFDEEYDLTTGTGATDPSAFLGQDRTALDRVANDVARRTVSAILEAF